MEEELDHDGFWKYMEMKYGLRVNEIVREVKYGKVRSEKGDYGEGNDDDGGGGLEKDDETDTQIGSSGWPNLVRAGGKPHIRVSSLGGWWFHQLPQIPNKGGFVIS